MPTTNPRSLTDPVRSSTAKASAIGAMPLPNIEMIRPMIRLRKAGSLSGAVMMARLRARSAPRSCGAHSLSARSRVRLQFEQGDAGADPDRAGRTAGVGRLVQGARRRRDRTAEGVPGLRLDPKVGIGQVAAIA